MLLFASSQSSTVLRAIPVHPDIASRCKRPKDKLSHCRGAVDVGTKWEHRLPNTLQNREPRHRQRLDETTTYRLSIHFASRGGARGGARSIPAPTIAPSNHLLIWPLRDFLKLGLLGSNKKLFHSLNCSVLLRWHRAQINLSQDLRRGVT